MSDAFPAIVQVPMHYQHDAAHEAIMFLIPVINKNELNGVSAGPKSRNPSTLARMINCNIC